MHQKQKKKKWLMTGITLVFFLVSGIWYYVVHFTGTAAGAGTGQNRMDETVTGSDTENTKSAENPVKSGEQTAESKQLTPEPVYCYVFLCGCIAKEGVYKLPEGSRLYEAVELAGGFTEDADEAYHNLARVIADGERVYIPSKKETESMNLKERIDDTASGRGTAADTSEKAKVNLNTATKEKLMELPGIGEAKAKDIMEYRTKVGAFATIEEIMNISGIGTAMFERIKEQITVE